MSSDLKKKLELLKVIAKINNSKLRNSVLNDLATDDTFFNVLQEIALNTVKGRVPLTKGQKSKIKCKRALHCLACPPKDLTANKKKRKKLVTQLGGGFWSLIIPALVALLASRKV